MKRVLLLLLLGCLTGLGTHTAWYAFRQPSTPLGLDSQLEWMRRELHLSPGQYARIKALHESSSPRLLLLSREVSRMQRELAAFEAERSSAGRIDFLEFARFVEARRSINHACLDSTRDLIASTVQVMDAQQRSLYRAWLGPISQHAVSTGLF